MLVRCTGLTVSDVRQGPAETEGILTDVIECPRSVDRNARHADAIEEALFPLLVTLSGIVMLAQAAACGEGRISDTGNDIRNRDAGRDS